MRRRYRERKAQIEEQNIPIVVEQTNTTPNPSESSRVTPSRQRKPAKTNNNSNKDSNYENVDGYVNSSSVSLKAIISQQSINVRNKKGVPYGIITDWNLLRSMCGNVYEVDIRKVVGYGANDKVNLLDLQRNIEKLILGKQIDRIVSSCIIGHNDVQTTDDVNWDKLISMSRTILNSVVEISQLQTRGYTNIDKISNAILCGIIPGTECRSADEFRTIFNKGKSSLVNRNNSVSGENSPQQNIKWKDATQKAINLMFQLDKCSRSEQNMSLSIIERLVVPDRYIAEWNQILRIWKVFVHEHKVDTKKLPNPDNVKFNHRPFPITGSSGIQELIKEIVKNT